MPRVAAESLYVVEECDQDVTQVRTEGEATCIGRDGVTLLGTRGAREATRVRLAAGSLGTSTTTRLVLIRTIRQTQGFTGAS